VEGSLAADSLVAAVDTAQIDGLEDHGYYNPVEVARDAQVDSLEIADTAGGHSLDEAVRHAQGGSFEAEGIVALGDLGTLVSVPLGIGRGSGTAADCCILVARVVVRCSSHLEEELDGSRLVVVVTEVGILLPFEYSQSVLQRSRSRSRYRLEH